MVTPDSAIRKARQEIGKEKMTLSGQEQLCYYRQMLTMRRFEEKAGQLYGMGLIGGFCHLYIGQEAVVAGVQSTLEEGDGVVTTYRDHAHMVAVGVEPKYIMAELLGREAGVSRGKGGSMHMFDTARNFYGGHGIVGAPVPIGTGIAFAHKYRGNGKVCTTYFGDGSLHQGQVYESFNMAKLWDLPVIYIIENNKYAMGTSVERSSSTHELYRRGESFNIPGHQVDGMDFYAVREAALMAVEHARSGKGPIILEMQTYRYRGHSMSDPAKYRSKEEVEEVKTKHDPLNNFSARLIASKYTTEAKLKAMDKDIREDIAEAVEWAKKSPEPDAKELYTDIYTEGV